jgi:uncharacterized DUF497 family protein
MRFECDSAKAASNLRKHGISFEDAATVLYDPLAVTAPDPDHSKFEERFITIGHTSKGMLIVMSHTDRGDTTRIISARRATRKERRNYEER